ncbi:MAG: winged helix DNA-binding domain-containing protein [Actinomycetota bacterium]|nr:winged helix DNA-binding domain-containing protein [Actinomycetota bacterium]
MSVVELSAAEARRAALGAQGLLGGGVSRGRGGVQAMLERLGAVQLDTISVLARSHELVPYSRLGAVGRDAVERAYWSGGGAFEYWAHAACVLPVEQWPLFSFRRRRFRARGQRWHKVPEGVGERVLERLRAQGPLTSTELGGAKRGGPWWDWSEVKVAVEWLLDVGEVACTTRRGFRRVYDLPERALPEVVLSVVELSDAECVRGLAEISGRALGVATVGDLAEFHRLTQAQVAAVLPDTSLVEVRVAGWRERAWAHPSALASLATRGRHRTTLLSPFDSLVWDRRRTLRMFDFTHRLEAYVPAPKRVHGYFAMPLLAGGGLAGRVDPGRDGRTLVAKRLSVTPRALDAMAVALTEAATWVGCDSVAVGEVSPPELAAPLRLALDR